MEERSRFMATAFEMGEEVCGKRELRKGGGEKGVNGGVRKLGE